YTYTPSLHDALPISSEILGGERGQKRRVHPNDEVNLGQSSNDIFPTAMHVAATVEIHRQLLPALAALRSCLQHKGEAFAGIVKIDRKSTRLNSSHVK